MALSSDRRSNLLAACPLFGGVAASGLAALAKVATEIEFTAGHVIARQGEIGTGFFVVVAGRVRVARDGAVLAHLGPGDFFGELSVLDGRPRNAMVAAEETDDMPGDRLVGFRGRLARQSGRRTRHSARGRVATAGGDGRAPALSRSQP